MLSVVVCTRDRSVQLRNCLHSFEELEPSDVEWELIVVINDSLESSKSLIDEFRGRGRLPLSFHIEPVQGLSRARNLGVTIAKGDILLFTDDDCLVAPNFLSQARAEFAADPSLNVLGGRVTLASDALLAVGKRSFADKLKITSLEQIMERLIGCNMAIRREVFDRIGTFDVRLGAGSATASAEDLDFFYRAFKAGMTIGYTPDVVVRHAHGRVSAEEWHHTRDGYIRGRGAFYGKHLRQKDRTILKHAYWEVSGLINELVTSRTRQDKTNRPLKNLRNLISGALLGLQFANPFA